MSRAVLIIEDNEEVRDMLGMALDGFIVMLLDDIIILPERVDFDPEVIVTDLTLPSTGDPSYIIDALKSKFPNAKIILLSGREEVKEVAKLYNLKYLKKPVDLDEVLAAVSED